MYRWNRKKFKRSYCGERSDLAILSFQQLITAEIASLRSMTVFVTFCESIKNRHLESSDRSHNLLKK
jgi:hypothetical protein